MTPEYPSNSESTGHSLEASVVAAVGAVFAAEPTIQVAVLFGSAARGELHPGSDIDIYVSLRPGAEWTILWTAGLAAAVEDICNRPVEIVVEERDRTSLLLRLQVARDGILLYQREPWAFTTLRANATIDYAGLADSMNLCAEGVRRFSREKLRALDGR